MDHYTRRILSDGDDTGQNAFRPLKILFLDNSFTFGGAIISLKRLVDGLEELGVTARVVSGQPQRVLHKQFGEKRTVPAQVRVPWRHRTRLQKLLRPLVSESRPLSRVARELSNFDWLLRRTFPDSLRYAYIGHRHDVDLIHLNNGLEGQISGLLAAKYLRVPCVAHARGFQRPSRLLNMLAGRVDRHIAISRAIERNLHQIGVPEDRIDLIYDAVDIEEYRGDRDTSAFREEIGIPERSKVFGFVGRMMKWKGVKEFVAAAIRVLQRHSDAFALIVGDESDGHRAYFRSVRQLARESAVSDRIVFTGYREDIPVIMQTLDILVHTSLDPEPFGLVLVEAMAAAKPVVASDRGGPLDIVLEGRTGLLVDPEDTEELAGSISRLLENRDFARELGRHGQSRAKGRFSTERYAREVRDLYRSLCS